MPNKRMVHGYYNRARKPNDKNENPRLCARNNIFNQMPNKRMVHGYHNRARKPNDKNENPRLCARNNIFNQSDASTAKLKRITRLN